ncbi:MAG: DegV family protein [Lachnospiraceae bacterium]|nr:DegV family protein [Lachnospiraceae bacterium]
MSGIAILTDSNSGITQAEAEKVGVYVLPMPFYINEEEYLEDISLSQEEFYQKLKDGADIHTSQPSPQNVLDKWDELLKEYDQIVYIPMSSGLSSSFETAKMLSEDYDGKVEVVNNQRISVTMRHAIEDAKNLIAQGKDAKTIREMLEEDKLNSTIYITLDTLYYLKKGGRITPAAAALGTLLKIKPVLQIQGEKLDAFAKARTIAAAKSTMITALKNDIEGRISEGGKYKYVISIAHTQNEEAALVFKDELQELFPDAGEIIINPLSLSVSCHIGPGALAVAASRIRGE